jgi:predicted DNA binding CopG/RHH family protein
MKLTKEEKELMESLERDEWKTIPKLKEEIKKSKAYARATIIKDQRMNIRIAKKDLDALKVKAIEALMIIFKAKPLSLLTLNQVSHSFKPLRLIIFRWIF